MEWTPCIKRHERLIFIINAKFKTLLESPFYSEIVFFYPDKYKADLPDSEFKTLLDAIERNFQNIDESAFTALLRQYINEKEVTAIDLYTSALIEKSYFYQILSGRHIPSRDTAIRITLALNLNFDDSARLLKTLGYSFFKKNRRDIIVIECIKHEAGLYAAELLLNKYKELSLCNKSILTTK